MIEEPTEYQFLEKFLERAENATTYERLASQLYKVEEKFKPDGFFMSECEMLDSTWMGTRTILPFGGDSTFKEVPKQPFSPRGLASDISVAKWVYRIPGRG